MPSPKAFIFDLNGTMIDDMDFHIKAWHGILTGFGANITLKQTKMECYGKNADVIERILPGRFTPEEMDKMSIEKERKYQAEFKPYLKLITGLDIFLENTQRNKIKMGIGSAAIMFNINFVLDGLQIRSYFDAIVSADDVKHSKPHPETFLKCAELLKVSPADCIVFEDSPKGVEAATKAGMKSVVLTTMHRQEEFSDDNIVCFTPNYNSGIFEKLLQAN